MDTPQIYVFDKAKTFNEFMQENGRDFTVKEIRIVSTMPVPLIVLIADVRFGLCAIMWGRYATVMGIPE